MRISVVIITYNEERNIDRCIKSVLHISDEVIVVDSFSTDNTVAIARGLGARVVEHVFEGYGAQKQFAIREAKNDWILLLDADESVSPELEKSILAIKDTDTHSAYTFNILTNYCGKWIRHGGWYPNKKIRLMDRSKGHISTDKVHEKWVLNEPSATVKHLRGDLLHYSYYTISDHIAKINNYSEISARADVERGKKCNMLKVYFAPKWFFIVQYIFSLGFLDGYYGYILSKNSSFYVYLKYTKIYLYSREKVKVPASDKSKLQPGIAK